MFLLIYVTVNIKSVIL